MKLILFRRCNFHWPSADRDRFQEAVMQHAVALAPRYIDGVARWDDTFTISFFEFRARLAALTIKNWSKLDVDMILMFNDVSNIPEKSDHMIIPVDDDDWFSPRLPQVLRAGGMVPAARWHSVEMSDSSGPYPIPHTFQTPTNGYAASWDTLEPLTFDERRTALMWHVPADENLRHPQWRDIDDYLSMSIKWPSSSESLKNKEPLITVAQNLYNRLEFARQDERCTEFVDELQDARSLLEDLIKSHKT